MSKIQMVHIDREQLKRVLKSKGITQKQLCEIIEPTELYPGGLSEGYLSRCLKDGSISLVLIDAIARALDVAPECLSSNKADYLMPYSMHQIELDAIRNNIAIGDAYKNLTQKEAMLEILLAHSTIHQVKLSDISKADQQSFLDMLTWTSLYFLKNKGYLEHTKTKSITDGQLLDKFHEILTGEEMQNE